MTVQFPRPTYDDDETYPETDEDDCMTCHGSGLEECETTTTAEGCWERDCTGTFHRCPNCRGSGRVKDQVHW